jgi:predicted transcriptional regulator
LELEEMVVRDEEALKVAEALTATTLKILRLLSQERLDVSTIATKLGLSEAYISEQVRSLEELGLVSANYERGRRGIRKVCETAVGKITFVV